MHWRTILRNVFSNWAGYAVTAAIGFLLSPFIVHSLGNTGYGLWTLVLSVTGYFGLLDLGIRSSVGRFIARYLALHDDERCNRTLSTAFSILLGGGMLALTATIIISRYFFHLFHVAPQFAEAGKLALLITGLNISCVLPLGVFSSLMVGMERFDILSGVTIIGELLRAALVVVFLKSGYGLITLALIALFISIAQYSVMAWFAKSLHRPLKLSWRLIDAVAFKELSSFGIYRFIWIVANQLIFYSDSLVIGMFLGIGAITPYAIAGALINYGRVFVSLLTDTFYPTATRLDAKQDSAGLRKLLILGTRITLFVAIPLCLGFVFLGRQFISLWMGKEYTSSAVFLGVLTISQFTSMSQYVSALVLAGMAKHRLLAYLVMAEGLINVLLSVILVRKIGLIGVAWGTVIPDVICMAVVVPCYTLRIVGLGGWEYVTQVFLRPLIAAAPIAALGYAFYRWAPTPSWALLVVEAGTMCASFAIAVYLLCLHSGQRLFILKKISNVFQRESAVHEA